MTDAPKRITYWWSEEQLQDPRVWIHHKVGGSVQAGDLVFLDARPSGFVEYRGGDWGAYLPEPPPPDEMSDRALRDVACRLRALADAQREHDVIGEVSASDMRHAAHVFEAALEWDRAGRPHSDRCNVYEQRLAHALRRRPR